MDSSRAFVLGVDLDGVVADYDGAMRDHVSKFKKVERSSIPDTTEWSLVNSGWPIKDEPDFMELHRRAVTEKRMFATMDVIPGASEALRAISDAGVRIRIVTFRLVVNFAHQIAIADTATFLDQHKIPYRDLCFLKDKNALSDLDLLIDDSPSNISAVRGQYGDDYAMVYNQPYNQGIPGLRAYSWDDVVAEVSKRTNLNIG